MSVSSWEPDPTGRHQYRWWDGGQWTDQVADDGAQSVDPVNIAEARLPHDSPPPVPPPSSLAPEEFSAPVDPGSPNPLLMLSSRGRRFGAYLLETLLLLVTLVIGWLIWALIVYARGQTPAKQVLKMRVVNLEKRRAASWGSMFVREWILKGALPIGLNLILLGILGTLWIVVGGIMILVTDRRQSVWDKMLKTVVVNDPGYLFDPPRLPRYQDPA